MADGEKLREGAGEKLRVGAGEKLRVGAGAKLREVDGATRMRAGATVRGATSRGSTRMRSGALGRGSMRVRSGALGRASDQEPERGGAVRRGASRVKESRAEAGMRGEALLRARGSDAAGTRWRVASEGAKRLLLTRVTLGGGAVRSAGTAWDGTRAADSAGPRGAREALSGAGAGRTLGAEAVR